MPDAQANPPTHFGLGVRPIWRANHRLRAVCKLAEKKCAKEQPHATTSTAPDTCWAKPTRHPARGDIVTRGGFSGNGIFREKRQNRRGNADGNDTKLHSTDLVRGKSNETIGEKPHSGNVFERLRRDPQIRLIVDARAKNRRSPVSPHFR